MELKKDYQEILSAHQQAMNDSDIGGHTDVLRLVFDNMDLSYQDLSGFNLSNASFVNANLDGANLSFSILRHADFRGAHAVGANFNYARVGFTNFRHSDFRHATMRHVEFKHSDLERMRLDNADLESADLSGVDPWDVQYLGFKQSQLVCPTSGEFYAWKKCRDNAIVKLLIPADALRSSATRRKCRASKVQVLEISDDREYAVSMHDKTFRYTIGDVIKVANFDCNRWNECAPGIHFFMTKEEAEKYMF